MRSKAPPGYFIKSIKNSRMFRFESPEFLYCLLVLPLLVGVYLYVKSRHRARMLRFGNLETIKKLAPDAAWHKVRLKYIFVPTAIAVGVIALARPQLGSRLKEIKKEGVEIMIAIDVSNSMLAEDIAPSRLAKTKYAISRLTSSLADDRIGLIVFAGDAFVQLPITSDFVSARNFVEYISTDMVSNQGTSIGKALDLASRSFSEQSEKGRAIILISDGEDHDASAAAVAASIAESGTPIHVIGVGSPEGAPITIGGEQMKDEDGNMVVTRLNETMLKELALASGGSYVRATNRSMGLEEIVSQIRKLESEEFSSMAFDEYNEQFQYLLVVMLLLLIIEFAILERKNHVIARMTLFNREDNNNKL